MDKVKKYQDGLVAYLSDFAKKSRLANMPDVENRVIAGLRNNSFQLLRMGGKASASCSPSCFTSTSKTTKCGFSGTSPNGKWWTN